MALLVRAAARRAGDSSSNPGPGENFSLKITSIKTVYSFFAILSYFTSSFHSVLLMLDLRAA